MKTKNVLFILIFLLIVLNSCSFKSYLLQAISEDEVQVDAVLVNEPSFIEGMTYIEGSRVDLGSTQKANEMPVHQVQIKSFYIDVTEVTVGEFREFCMSTGRKMPEQPPWNLEDHPVVNVNWKDATDYAAWAGKRLPTEAEWEYATRGSDKGYGYLSGNIIQYGKKFGNIADESIRQIKARFPALEGYDDSYIYTAPVGSFCANQFGIMDLDGNVLEWCTDWYDENYYAESPKINPKGPESGIFKVIRGASWNRSGDYLRATFRSWYHPDCKFDFLGFRCAMDKDSIPTDNTSTLTRK